MKKFHLNVVTGLLTLFICGSVQATFSYTFTFIKVADSDTIIPGTSQTFEDANGTFDFPAIDGMNVASDTNEDVGDGGDAIFLFDGTSFWLVVDVTTAIPGIPGNTFDSDFDDDIALDGTTVTFEGLFDGDDQEPISVSTVGPGLITLVDTANTLIPGSTETFKYLD